MAAESSDRTTGSDLSRSQWSIDREVVLSRVFDAPRELVWKAWTDKEHIGQWFGPKGFTIQTHEIDVRVGGRWRFDMIAPDGTRYDNRMVFLQLERPTLLVIDHGHDADDDPNRFRLTLTFDEQSNNKTVVTLRQLHPTKERRLEVIGFGAVEFGYQTLDKLGQHLGSM